MVTYNRPFESVAELHETELEARREIIAAGYLIAVPEAVFYCAKYKIPMPQWLAEASANYHCLEVAGRLPRSRGRSSSIVGRRRQDTIDALRYEEVTCIIEDRGKLQNDIEELQRMSGKRARIVLAERKAALKKRGTSLEHAFSYASFALRHTPCRGGPDAIKDSYNKVSEAMLDPNQAMRYRGLDTGFLMRIGAYVSPFRPVR